MNQVIRNLLKPAGLVYEPAVSLRNLAYAHGLMDVHHAPVPVISVGNITVGGTGKTPVVISLAKQFIAQGKKVAVLSRGYGRKSSGVVVVSDGRKLLCNPQQSGDEPSLVAQKLKEAVVIVAARRAESARVAVNDYGCDVILLDDGFQHRAIGRDLDVVLVGYNHDLMKDSMLPAGNLREPLSELKRAGLIVITNVPQTPDNGSLQALSNNLSQLAPGVPQHRCSFTSSKLVPIGRATPYKLNELVGKKVTAFCGIANPDRFFNQLQDLSMEVSGRQAYSDHHWYQDTDLQEIRRKFEDSGSNLIVTTAKDAVRLQSINGASREILVGLPLYYLDIDTVWLSDIQSVISGYSSR